MNSPIVNINPSINHPMPSNNYAFSTENSNARSKPKAMAEPSSSSTTTTTDDSLSSLDDESSDEALKQECAGSILTDRYGKERTLCDYRLKNIFKSYLYDLNAFLDLI